MSDYEGSRSEFMKLLAEFGEEPAFVSRAKAHQIALDGLLATCRLKRDEWLEWPTFHLSVLANQVGRDWSRLRCLLAPPETVHLLAELQATLDASKPVQTGWLTSDRTALSRFLESANRFNRHWADYVNGLDLEKVNKPRRAFNQFYVIERACALGSEREIDPFEPLELIKPDFLLQRFPLLKIPRLRDRIA